MNDFLQLFGRYITESKQTIDWEKIQPPSESQVTDPSPYCASHTGWQIEGGGKLCDSLLYLFTYFFPGHQLQHPSSDRQLQGVAEQAVRPEAQWRSRNHDGLRWPQECHRGARGPDFPRPHRPPDRGRSFSLSNLPYLFFGLIFFH